MNTCIIMHALRFVLFYAVPFEMSGVLLCF